MWYEKNILLDMYQKVKAFLKDSLQLRCERDIIIYVLKWIFGGFPNAHITLNSEATLDLKTNGRRGIRCQVNEIFFLYKTEQRADG